MGQGLHVDGYCPMGCGETLWVTPAGHLYCIRRECPDADALATIVGDSETEHVAEFFDGGFSIQHPLRCRLVEGGLLECEILHQLRSLDGPPVENGRYRVTRHQPDAYSESYRSGMGGLDYELIE